MFFVLIIGITSLFIFHLCFCYYFYLETVRDHLTIEPYVQYSGAKLIFNFQDLNRGKEFIGSLSNNLDYIKTNDVRNSSSQHNIKSKIKNFQNLFQLSLSATSKMMPQGYLFPYIECLRSVRPAYVNYSDGTLTIHEGEIVSFYRQQTEYSQSFWSIAWSFRISHFRIQNFFLDMLSNDTDRQMILYGRPLSKKTRNTKLLCWNPIRAYHSKPVMTDYRDLNWNEKKYVELLNYVESSLQDMKKELHSMIFQEFLKFSLLLFVYFFVLIGLIWSRSISNILAVINGLIKINYYRKKTYDIFLSHEWGANEENHKFVSKIESFLHWFPAIKSFLDENNLSGKMTPELKDAIKDSELFLIFLTETYNKKLKEGNNYCYLEFKEAQETKNGKIVLVVTDRKMKKKDSWETSLREACEDLRFVDMTGCENLYLIQYLYPLYRLVNDIVSLYHKNQYDSDNHHYEWLDDLRPKIR